MGDTGEIFARLQELVRRDLALEVVRRPHLAQQRAELLDQRRLDVRVVGGEQEEVAQRRHARERLHDHVDVVGVLDVVEPDEPRHVV